MVGTGSGCVADGDSATGSEPAELDVDLYRGSVPLCVGADNGIVYETETWPCGSCVVRGAPGSQEALYAKCRRGSQWKLIQVSCASCAIEEATDDESLSTLAGGPPCQECLDVLDACTDDDNTPAEGAACSAAFRECRVNRC
jgi:hypothetical protein